MSLVSSTAPIPTPATPANLPPTLRAAPPARAAPPVMRAADEAARDPAWATADVAPPIPLPIPRPLKTDPPALATPWKIPLVKVLPVSHRPLTTLVTPHLL